MIGGEEHDIPCQYSPDVEHGFKSGFEKFQIGPNRDIGLQTQWPPSVWLYRVYKRDISVAGTKASEV
jgi:hypothetical protein